MYILAVFAMILLLAWIKVPLTIAIMAGTILTGFLFGLNTTEVIATSMAGVVQPRTIALAVVTMLILVLSATMRDSGQFEQIVSAATMLFRRSTVTMAALPALVGLLPMPGGALFSAPMVESAAADNKIDGSVLSAVNYWFRHIWEHWWPLYPGVILAMTLTGFSFARFAIFQIPAGIFMAAAGILIFRKTHPDLHKKSAPPPSGTKRKFLVQSSSIWMVLLVWIITDFAVKMLLLPVTSDTIAAISQKYLPLFVGLLAAIVWTIFLKRIRLSTMMQIFARKSIYSMGALVISVMIFQYIIAKVGAAEQIASALMEIHIPVVLIVATLPFIAGMVTGLAIGFVGTSFPIVLALIAALPASDSIAPYVILAYGFGHLGEMASPIHLCHMVSNQYFNTGYSAVYKRMLPSLILTALLLTAYFAILKILI